MSVPPEVREEVIEVVRSNVWRFAGDGAPAAAVHYLGHHRDRLTLEELGELCRWAWEMMEEATDPELRGAWERIAWKLVEWEEQRRALDELIRDCGGDPRGSP